MPEQTDFDQPIWVLKYDIYFYPECHSRRGNFCPPDTPGAQKFTDCHGWYASEDEALTAQRSMKGKYSVEKVYRRRVPA